MRDNSDQNQLSGPALIGLICLAVLVVGALAWHGKKAEISLFSLRTNFLLLKPFGQHAYELQELIRRLAHNPGQLAITDLLLISNQVARHYLPFALLLPLYGLYRGYRHPLAGLHDEHTAQSLLEALNKVFPYTSPILHFDPNTSTSAKWASSMPPYKFALKHKLVNGKGRLNRDRAAKVLREQVGPLFNAKKLRPYERALFAVFAAKLGKDPNAQKLIDDLARSSKDGKTPAYALADPFFREHFRQADPFRKIHRYTRTLLCSMFDASKLRGKITPSMFLWLKPIDRTLFYALNRVGSQVPFAEGMGVWSHWKAEQVAFTGESTIDWLEFLEEDPVTEQMRWPDIKPAWDLKQIWVEPAIVGLEEDLRHTGVVTV